MYQKRSECFITSTSAESGFSDPLRLIIDDCVTAICCRVDGNVAARCAGKKCVVIVLSKYLAGYCERIKNGYYETVV